MRRIPFAGALASGLAVILSLVSTAALADDPNDPAMRDPAARARDRAIIRQLNLRELAHVQKRDAGYAEGWRAYREAQQRGNSSDDYAQAQRRYQREMAEWRRAVAACRAGDYRACGG